MTFGGPSSVDPLPFPFPELSQKSKSLPESSSKPNPVDWQYFDITKLILSGSLFPGRHSRQSVHHNLPNSGSGIRCPDTATILAEAVLTILSGVPQLKPCHCPLSPPTAAVCYR